MLIKISEIRSVVNRLAKKVGASKNMLPTFGFSEQSGRPHIEVDSNGYHFVIAERGQEIQRHTTLDIDEILYHVFQVVSFELASMYELSHRIPGQDSRRLLFEYQEELLSLLNPVWGERKKVEHAKILYDHPFNDAL